MGVVDPSRAQELRGLLVADELRDRPLPRPFAIWTTELTIRRWRHLDVLTAARQQNDGRPEPSSLALAEFALAVTGSP